MPASAFAADEREGCAEAAVCPICFAELIANREEVGALTYQECRVEQTLYHLGCITMMLCHEGSREKCQAAAENGSSTSGTTRETDAEKDAPMMQVSLGLSPMTRQKVNGFALVPPIDELEKWIKFMDWKCAGHVDLVDLAVQLSLSLPVSQSVAELALRRYKDASHAKPMVIKPMPESLGAGMEAGPMSPDEASSEAFAAKEQSSNVEASASTEPSSTTELSKDHDDKSMVAEADSVLSMVEFRSTVLPHIMERLSELRAASKTKSGKHSARRVTLPELDWRVEPNVIDLDMMAADLWSLSDICSLQAVSKQLRPLARLILVSEACMYLECPLEVARSKMRGPRQTIAAVRLLSHNVDWGDVRAFEAAVSALDTDEEIVLQSVPTLLAGMVARGDQRALAVVASRLHHPWCGVRRAAVAAMEQIAVVGDPLVIEAFVGRLGDSDSSVRWRAVQALMQTANAGNQHALTSIYRCLVSPRVAGGSFQNQAETKRALLKVMGTLAKKGDQQAIAAAAAQLVDGSFSVRIAALTIFGQLAERGDDFVIETLLSTLEVSDPHMRWAALPALAQVSLHGDSRVVDALLRELSSQHTFIQQEALRAITQVADMAQPHIAKCVAGLCFVEDSTTRWAAVQTLGAMIADNPTSAGVQKTSHDIAAQALASRLEDEDALVRLDAARHLGHMNKSLADTLPAHSEDMDSLLASMEQSRDPEPSEEFTETAHVACSAGPSILRCAFDACKGPDAGEWTTKPFPVTPYLQCSREGSESQGEAEPPFPVDHPARFGLDDLQGRIQMPAAPKTCSWGEGRSIWRAYL